MVEGDKKIKKKLSKALYKKTVDLNALNVEYDSF